MLSSWGGGTNTTINIAKIDISTSNSIKVKALVGFIAILYLFCPCWSVFCRKLIGHANTGLSADL